MDERLEDRLRRIWLSTGKLLSLHVDVLYRCNLDCCHCYLDDKRTDEMTTEQLLSVLEQARTLGALKLTLSGGELFLRPDIVEILQHARRLNYYIKLKTHGGTVTERLADTLKTIGIGRVDISLYALDDDVHDAITRRKGSLVRTLRGIDRLKARGIDVRVNCVVMEPNRHVYKDLYHEMTRRQIPCSLDGSVRGTNSLSLESYALGLSAVHKKEFEEFRRKTAGGRPKPLAMDPDDHICWAGKTSLHIQPDGTVTPCVAWPMSLGNVRDVPLEQIWTHSPMLAAIRDARRKDRTGCQTCTFESKCVYCPGKAYVENRGDWLSPFQLQCTDTATRIYGTLGASADWVRPHRTTGLFKTRSGQPETLHQPTKPTVGLSPEWVLRHGRSQQGEPRKRLFSVLSPEQAAYAKAEHTATTVAKNHPGSFRPYKPEQPNHDYPTANSLEHPLS